MVPLTRRRALSFLALPAAGLSARFTSRHGLARRKAAPRGKPSGLPFHANFTDVAGQAGSGTSVVAGHPQRADYVIEAMSCGVAFFDYDNDGWLDILVLSGSRFGDPPARCLQPPLQEQPRRHLHRCHRKGRTVPRPGTPTASPSATTTTTASRICSSPAGDRTCSTATTATAPSPMSRRQAGLLNPQARFGSGCTFVDYDRDGRLDLFVSNYLGFDIDSVPRAGQSKSCSDDGVFCGPRGLPYGAALALSQQRRRHVYRCHGRRPASASADGGYGLTAVAADFDNDGWPDIYVACDSTPEPALPQQPRRHLHRAGARDRRGPQRRRHGAGRHGLRASAISELDGNLRHRQNAFRRRHAGGVSQRRQGQFSRCHAALRPRRGNALRRSGASASRTSITTAIPISSASPAASTRNCATTTCTPRVVFRNLGKGRFEELIGARPDRASRPLIPAAAARSATSTTTATSTS